MGQPPSTDRPHLRVSLDDGVLTLLIDREERRNALSREVLDGMLAALREPPADARVVLVASTGERVFSAGMDLAVMAGEATGMERHEARSGLAPVVLAMRDCALPVVAQVQGLCLAGAVGLVLGCDLVVASDEAELGLPEVDRGIWPFMVGALLARHVSPKVALDLMLTARRVPAREALALGLVSRVVPAASLSAEVGALCAQLGAAPPVAVRLGKAAWVAAAETALAPALAAMAAQLSLLTTTADAAEGIEAFFAKRAPAWVGR